MQEGLFLDLLALLRQVWHNFVPLGAKRYALPFRVTCFVTDELVGRPRTPEG